MVDKHLAMTVQQLNERCKAMVDDFLTPKSQEQVNVSSHMRLLVEKVLSELNVKSAQLAARLKGGATTAATDNLKALARSALEPVVKEVFSVLEVITFARFLRSETAVRASELISWTDEFRRFATVEQSGALERLGKLTAENLQPASQTLQHRATPDYHQPAKYDPAGVCRRGSPHISNDSCRITGFDVYVARFSGSNCPRLVRRLRPTRLDASREVISHCVSPHFSCEARE